MKKVETNFLGKTGNILLNKECLEAIGVLELRKVMAYAKLSKKKAFCNASFIKSCVAMRQIYIFYVPIAWQGSLQNTADMLYDNLHFAFKVADLQALQDHLQSFITFPSRVRELFAHFG